MAGCCGCRNEGKSAQEVSQQLKEPGASWLDRTTRTLGQAVLHDATLESWQELYRAVPSLDWGAGAPVAVAASKQVSVYLMQAFHNLPVHMATLLFPVALLSGLSVEGCQ